MSKSESSTDKPLKTIDVYTAIDLDRTILRSTALFYDHILPALRELYGFNEVVIELVQSKERDMRGQAFDFIAYCDSLASDYRLKPIDIEELAVAIVDRQRTISGQINDSFVKSIIVDGTLQLMSELASHPDERWGIMTSGGVLTQSLKCLVVGAVVQEKLELSFPVQILSTEHKAQTIVSEWYDETFDIFVLPEVVARGELMAARTIRLLDDKPKNLELAAGTLSQVKSRLDLYLVQVAESSVREGSSIVDVLQKIQRTR